MEAAACNGAVVRKTYLFSRGCGVLGARIRPPIILLDLSRLIFGLPAVISIFDRAKLDMPNSYNGACKTLHKSRIGKGFDSSAQDLRIEVGISHCCSGILGRRSESTSAGCYAAGNQLL
jgi:hypothetical protein